MMNSRSTIPPPPPPPAASSSTFDHGRLSPNPTTTTTTTTTNNNNNNSAIEPQKLELILNDNGSLQTAPLLNVVLATTDSLYGDIANMADGEIMVTTSSSSSAGAAGTAGGTAGTGGNNGGNGNGGGNTNNYEDGAMDDGGTDGFGTNSCSRPVKMASLNFAQRRHELAWRLASHSKAIQHVAALHMAANNNNNNNDDDARAVPAGTSRTVASSSSLGKVTSVGTQALQHARTAWIQADEAQDALYFGHANLFPARRAPHDVYGACDTMIVGLGRGRGRGRGIGRGIGRQRQSNGRKRQSRKRGRPNDSNGAEEDTEVEGNNDNDNDEDSTDPTPTPPPPPPGWYDLPSDIRLLVDRYDASAEKQWTTQQVAERWHMAVRRKLLRGEVGWMKRQRMNTQQQQQQQRQQQHDDDDDANDGGGIGSTTTTTVDNDNNIISSMPPPLSVPVSPVPWNISLRGGIVRLTHGTPKTVVDITGGDTTTNTTTTTSSSSSTKTVYPLEAVLTVLSPTTNVHEDYKTGDNDNTTPNPTMEAEWTLVSIEVHAQAKTGQSNHQLEQTNKQRFNLHRMCALAMTREEARARTQWQRQRQRQRQRGHEHQDRRESHRPQSSSSSSVPPMARPLDALFHVAHYFALSWQLEILSAQAQALRKGLWGGVDARLSAAAAAATTTTAVAASSSSAGATATSKSASLAAAASSASSQSQQQRRRTSSSNVMTTSSLGSSLVVTPVQFFDNRSVLGIVSISFWSVDDRYGPPSMGDLFLEEDEENNDNNHHDDGGKDCKSMGGGDSVSTVSRSLNDPAVTNQLTLSVRAEPNVGIRVSLSGAESIMEYASSSAHIRDAIRDLLEATSNPFCLSASEALLAATRLCAERKCHAMVQVLPDVLPSWIVLRVERGSIAVAAKIRYDSTDDDDDDGTNDNNGVERTIQTEPVVLFRLACDARTGSFVCTFSRSARLLQYLACNDVRAASDTTLLRMAQLSKSRRPGTSSLAGSSSTSSSARAASVFASGRAVRDAFESLGRSMNVLGQRTGVGIDAWKDHNDSSASLRRRAIQSACQDVKISLMTCCGMAALYGMAAVAMGVATGVQPTPDMAGGKVESKELEVSSLPGGMTRPPPASSLLPTPPLSILMDQKIVDDVKNGNNSKSDSRLKQSHAEQELFGVCCSVDESRGVTLHAATMTVQLASPSSIPTRTSLVWTKFETLADNDTNGIMNGGGFQEPPPSKRTKINGSNKGTNNQSSTEPHELMMEVERFASILSKTLATT